MSFWAVLSLPFLSAPCAAGPLFGGTFVKQSSNAHQNIRFIPARLALGEVPAVEQTCFLHWDVSVRNTNCKDFFCSHEKGRKQLVNVSQMVKLLASLRRGPPIQMAHYFNIWIFILLKHLFFFFFSWFYLAS